MNLVFGIFLAVIAIASTGFFAWSAFQYSDRVSKPHGQPLPNDLLMTLAVVCGFFTGSATIYWFIVHV